MFDTIQSAGRKMSADVRFCTAFWLARIYAFGMMAELDKVFSSQAMMSPLEILQQFKKVFGRDMTEAECKIFFLPIPPNKDKQP